MASDTTIAANATFKTYDQRRDEARQAFFNALSNKKKKFSEEAIEEIERLLEDPIYRDIPYVYYSWAKQLFHNNHKDKALQACYKALQNHKNARRATQIASNTAKLLWENHCQDYAITVLEKLVEGYPQSQTLMAQLGSYYQILGSFDKAAKLIERFTPQEQLDDISIFLYLKALKAQKRFNDIISFYENIKDARGNNLETVVFQYLMAAYAHTNQHEKVIETYLFLPKSKRQDVSIGNLYAKALLDTGQSKRALKAARTNADRDPSKMTLNTLANAYLQNGQSEDAYKTMKKLLDNQKALPGLLREIALQLMEEGELDKAITLLKPQYDQAHIKDPRDASVLAMGYIFSEQPKTAINTLLPLLDDHKDNPHVTGVLCNAAVEAHDADVFYKTIELTSPQEMKDYLKGKMIFLNSSKYGDIWETLSPYLYEDHLPKNIAALLMAALPDTHSIRSIIADRFTLDEYNSLASYAEFWRNLKAQKGGTRPPEIGFSKLKLV